jgi:hypothetical protein
MVSQSAGCLAGADGEESAVPQPDDEGIGLLDGGHPHGAGQGQHAGAADQEDHLVVQAGAQVGMPPACGKGG